jgi:DegV family protein with EDD domain
MSIKIVTDSTCDLPASVIAENDLTVVPCYINMDDKSYLDGVELSRGEFYAALPGCRRAPTTSAPGIGAFVQAYRRLAEDGATAILSIHISGALSNVVKVAELAAREISELPVQVIDSTQLTLGTGLQALEAARLAQAGASLEEITAALQDLARRTYTFAVVDTLEYLRRSGRVSGLVSGLGELLQLKPILKMHAGVSASERIRTRTRAHERLLELVEEQAPFEHLSLVHASSPERAAALGQAAAAWFPPAAPSFCQEVTPVIGAHTGPGTAGFVLVTARR